MIFVKFGSSYRKTLKIGQKISDEENTDGVERRRLARFVYAGMLPVYFLEFYLLVPFYGAIYVVLGYESLLVRANRRNRWA